MPNLNKILIIRFSSFGDIAQSLSVISSIKGKFPNSEIHFLTRSDYSTFLSLEKQINRVWSFDRSSGLKGLMNLSLKLRNEKFDGIYDAHNNLRSKILRILLFTFKYQNFIKRPKNRFRRFLLFYLRINTFSNLYGGMISYIMPLHSWGIYEKKPILPVNLTFSQNVKESVSALLKNNKTFIALAPSAAWDLKRWPINYWEKLIELLDKYNFVLLGGKQDSFLNDIAKKNSRSILNLAGLLDYSGTAAIIEASSAVVSADTGVLHVADLLGKKGIALIGPTAFG